MTQDITIETIDSVLKEKSVNLIQFSAEWCGPCRMLTPIISTLSEEYKDKDVNIIKVNVDENKELAEKYSIRSIPTVIVFKESKEEARVLGMNSKSKYEEMINSLLN
jgi:thioredoxin 1